MKPLRSFLDKVKPKFSKGAPLEKWFPIFDVFRKLILFIR